jgi:hypothetical protein
MKTLTKNNRSLHMFDDSEVLIIGIDHTVVGDPPVLIISDCNSTNTVLHENITTPPEDWFGTKYLYTDNVWSPDPTWRDMPSHVE